MTETAETKPRKKGMLIPIAATLILGGAGFASTYLGLWSPAAMLSAPAEAKAGPVGVQAEFVDIPTIEIIIPGGRARSLILSATIESDAAHKAQVQHLMPRVSDAFTTFLSDVDPSAYDKRGVLEIIRTELVGRTRLVLGDEAVKDLLITEFRFK
ncbi:flagellar basal body-associated FliL family protein [Paracoccus sediminilitoris]|uniref:flagellar basal body-associated FliL family protein n=1 Tax=Paracoccus sediminilitoris TaxID=2202419 RepID=UPI000DBA8BA6|nr:flagellar basal body-associated FliL family protein [Paracoccus sediminilitoris]